MQELDAILHATATWAGPLALATIVRTEGSSYRKAGARMLIDAAGRTLGAVSGGCVEREVAHRARPVLAGAVGSVLMSYDGRLRLGCNGTLHILIEPLALGAEAARFRESYARTYAARRAYRAVTWFAGAEGDGDGADAEDTARGTALELDGAIFPLGTGAAQQLGRSDGRLPEPGVGEEVLHQTLEPARQLIVFGGEADAFVLARMAALAGLQTTLVAHPRNPVDPPMADGTGEARGYRAATVAPEELATALTLDARTAVVLMSHSYPRDYAYLVALLRLGRPLPYLGLLGPRARREDLLTDLFDAGVDLPAWLEGALRGPVGLPAVSGRLPGEIAVSVLGEVLGCFEG